MVISLNNQKKLFVFRSGGQLATATFADVQRDTRFMASKLQRLDLLPDADDFGHLTGFEKFEHARKAWATSAYSVDTWFTPGTPDAVQHLLERFRLSGAPIRLFIGDPETGRDWLKQHVFGRLDCTGGQLRWPLLLPTDGQPAETIDSRLVLRIMDSDGTELPASTLQAAGLEHGGRGGSKEASPGATRCRHS